MSEITRRDFVATGAIALGAGLGTGSATADTLSLSVLNVFARNLPLLLVLGAVGVLVWPKSAGETLPVSNSDAGRRATVASAGAGLNGAHHQYRQRMAIGTFVIGALIVGAAISAALGPFPALSVPHFIS